ncbi:MAG TPA: DoxX family protein [Euzebyales bacterium]
MNIAVWALQILLGLIFLTAGGIKVATSRDKLLENPNMAWVEDFSAGTVRTIGALEMLAGIGLILPSLLGIAPLLSPLAALGLGIVMVGAAIAHVRRGESQPVVMNVVLLAVAAFVAWARFGPYAL